MKQVLTIVIAIGIMAGMGRAELAEFVPGQYWSPAESLPEVLAEAHDMIETGQSSKARRVLKKWIKGNEESEFLDHGLYLKAMACFQQEKYYQAAEACDELCRTQGTSRFFEPSLYMQVEIARLYMAGEKRKMLGFIRVSGGGDAVAILDNVIEGWPGSELAAQALTMQGDYYFGEERFVEAQDTYQMVVDYYPNSGYYYHGLLWTAEATHKQYRGAYYDSRCLTDAAIRYSRFAAEFPEQAAELDIAGRIRQVRTQQAEKEFTIADFYRRTDKSEAAFYYWREITERFGDTEFAAQARELIEQYQDRAAEEAGHV